MIFKGSSLKKSTKNHGKNDENSMQILNGKKSPQNASKSGFRRVLGFIWEGFGTVLGLFSTLLRDFWLFFGRSKSSFCKAWAPDGPQEAFWMDFRQIWVGFGKGFGGVRENFGAFFCNFFRIFSNFFGTCFALRFNLARKGLAYFVQVFLCQGLTLCVFARKTTYFC